MDARYRSAIPPGILLICLVLGIGVYIVVLRPATPAMPGRAEAQRGPVPEAETAGVRHGNSARPATMAIPPDDAAAAAQLPAGGGTVTDAPEAAGVTAFRAVLAKASLVLEGKHKRHAEVVCAVGRLERAPIRLLQQHHDEVHAIGWVEPGLYYKVLLRAGTTRAQRQRLRAEFGVPNDILAKYGDDADMEFFVKDVEAEIAEAVSQEPYIGHIEGLERMARLDFTRGGPLTAFFIKCLNSPQTFPYLYGGYGGRISVACLAMEEYFEHDDRDMWAEFVKNYCLFDPANPQQKARHEAYLRRLEKYFADTRGWKVSFQVPYLFGGLK